MDGLNDILQLPERCLLSKKITKAFFKRNFELTSFERSLLDDPVAVSSIDWIASIGPANANIPAYSGEMELFEEAQVITVATDNEDFGRNAQRIAELIQKYIPYHILLCVYNTDGFVLNACNKRINQNDNNRRTIEKRYFTEFVPATGRSEVQKAFLVSIAFGQLDKTSLKTLYESYLQRIIALQASGVSGTFTPRSGSRSIEDMQRLEQINTLEREILMLQNQAKKESQMNQRVALNLQLQQKRQEIENLKGLLTQ